MQTIVLQQASGTSSTLGRLRAYVLGSQLRRNMCASAGLTAIGLAIAAISYPLYLKKLGYEQYGLWLVLSTVLSLAQVSNLGISQALAKYVAANRSDENALQGYTTTALALTASSALFLWAISFLFRDTLLGLLALKPAFQGPTREIFPILVLFSGYLFCVDVTNNILNGAGRLDLCVTCQITAQLTGFIVSAILILQGMGIKGMLLGNLVGYVLAHILSLRLAQYHLGVSIFDIKRFSLKRGKELISFGGWMMSTTLLSLFFNPFNRIVIGRFGSLAQVPIYDIAFSMGMRVRNLFEVTQRSLTAEVSKLATTTRASETRIGIRRLNRKCILLVCAAAPLFITLGLGAEPLAKLWLRSRFEAAVVPVIRVMLIGSFFSLIGTPGFYTLLGLGQARRVFMANLLQSGINAILTIGLIVGGLRLGALATATIVSISMTVSAIYLLGKSYFAEAA